MKSSLIPVVVGALGLFGKDSDRYIERIPGSPRLKEIKKKLIFTSPHFRKSFIYGKSV